MHMPIKAKLYRHQIEAINFICMLFGLITGIVKSFGAALLMEMGTGKTLITIAVIGALYQERKIKKVLIVAPLSILGVWEEEFEQFADFSYKLIVLNGTISKKIQQLKALSGDGVHVVVVNYESAWRMEKQLIDWLLTLSLQMKGTKSKRITRRFQRLCTGWG